MDAAHPFARVLAVIASFAFAALYRGWSGTAVAPAEVLLISVGAGVATLAVGAAAQALLVGRDGGWRIWPAVLRNLLVIALLVSFAALAGLWLPAPADDRWNLRTLLQFALVAAMSGLVGFGELVSRYRDQPGKLFASAGAATYVGVNVVAGIGALMLVQEFEVFKDDAHARAKEILLAGFGAIAFFRSSLFTVRVGGSDVGIGPSAMLKSLLDASDLMIDRWQAGNRSYGAAELMRGVDFDRAKTALPVLCFSLMEQAPTPAQQEAIRKSVDDLAADTGTAASAKPLLLGVYLIRIVGPDVLATAVRALGSAIR